MSNIVKGEPTKKSGFYDKGYSHANGGIEVTVDGITKVEVEKDEYKLCKEAYYSTKTYDFKQKTNMEILDHIFQDNNCVFEIDKAESGDFILCKSVVMDNAKHDRSGTPAEILNKMQEEKQCRVELPTNSMASTGGMFLSDWYLSFLYWWK